MEKIMSSDFATPKMMREFLDFYRRLSGQQEPLYQLDDFFGMGRVWIAFRHEDAVSVLKDPRFVKDMHAFTLKAQPEAPDHGETPAESTEERENIGKLLEWMKNMPNMLTTDPPDHTRLRRLASKAFTPQMIAGLQPRIQQIADELLDAVIDRGSMELIAEFAYPLPIIVISEMLGIPEADRNKFRTWTRELTQASLSPGQGDKAIQTLELFTGYIKALLEKKRAHPASDVMTGLVQAHDESNKLSENELLSTIWLLITAGHETTVNLIANGTLALLQHPEQLRLLRDDPSLLPSAVEELLRYASPVMIGSRFAAEDLSLRGRQIRKGDIVVLSLPGANFDPHAFDRPEELNITREENEHLAFGKGIHLCLGAPLARLEGRIALGTLLRRLPHLRLAIDPAQLMYAPSTMRSLERLPVAF